MGLTELLKWQWDGYPTYHQSRTNLLLHIVFVPVFLIGNLCLLAGFLSGSPYQLVAGLVLSIVGLSQQGRGHKMEPVAPVPFSSKGNAVARLLLENWITFPRFVVSGGWFRNLQASAAK